ncbi:MAG: thymidine phosphorylase [Woeseiaceae bacterium]|nr:thymidine phosphorylase [Woeseiaceae bacterium]
MLFTDIIRKKRDGGELSAQEIAYFVAGLADGSIPPEQISSLAMAIFLNSMSAEEASALTMAMARSGTVLDWSGDGLDGPVVDKHSTGGVGDKVSLMLAPIAAACGCFVPMISGRGLGHTGGTTDKVESIPGYRSMPDFDHFRKVVKSVGCAIIGQTTDLAPADRRFYAIRDVTGTVESIPLITASILAKKIAAGLDGLVMDVKVGSGAFMPSYEKSEQLARSIIATASKAGLRTHALLTDMNEVLGLTAGNALEVVESVEYLTNAKREQRLDEVVRALCLEMLVLTGVESDREAAARKVEQAIVSGQAAEIFGRMVAALGGPKDFVTHYRKHLPVAKVQMPVTTAREGYLSEVNAFAIGNAIIELGGGRRVLGEQLDLSVGFSNFAPIGTYLDSNVPLAIVHAANSAKAERAADLLRCACTIADSKPPARPVIYDSIAADF